MPQYEKAAEKVKAMQGVTAAKAVGQAVQRYFLINGSYPTKWEDLDISYNMSTHLTNPEKGGYLKYFIISFNMYDNNEMVLLDRMGGHNYRYTIVYCLNNGTMWCGAYAANEQNGVKDKGICEAIGGKEGYTLPPKCGTYRAYTYKL
ncbi:MAG: hypothetical protein LBG16_05030 [Elusimicrobiota bacterium]|nr:hypothetical protein [Elusimicrobiota bacterium]